jgi:hypothetical protein
MFLQILNNPRPFGPLEIIFLCIFCVIAGVIVGYFIMRDRPRVTAPATFQALDATQPQPILDEPTPTTGGFKWRKPAPALIAVGLIALFVLLQFALKQVPALNEATAALPLPSTGILPDVDGATQDTKQALGGYVQFGTLISKIIVLVIFYAIGSILPWAFQQLTHPGPTKWKKEQYTADFNALESRQKFEVDAKLGLNAAIRWAAVVIGACLIQ